MSEHDRAFDGPNWRDDPLENTPIVRLGVDFLTTRGHRNPEIFRFKMGLVEKIRLAVQAKKWTQTEVAQYVNSFDQSEHLDQPDVSRILNGNLDKFSMDKLILVLAALDNKVSVRSEPVASGKGCIVMADCD